LFIGTDAAGMNALFLQINVTHILAYQPVVQAAEFQKVRHLGLMER